MAPRIIIQNKVGSALTGQKSIDTSNYPYTLNTTIGCLFGCNYCYLQEYPFNKHTEFGKEIIIKAWLPDKLDQELGNLSWLPQHLKRVQVNSATEGYLPQAIRVMDDQLGRDLMKEVLEVFQRHWLNGNKWMIHIVTKSHLILNHLELIASMKEQVQIELTITSLDETRARSIEGTAPSVTKRKQVIQKFSSRGVFVRIMCMPFIGTKDEAKLLRDELFKLGARGFKHKAMNYWDEDEILKGKTVKAIGKEDIIFKALHIKSGEDALLDDNTKSSMTVSMPDKKWSSYSDLEMTIVDWGYSELNDVKWGYIR